MFVFMIDKKELEVLHDMYVCMIRGDARCSAFFPHSLSLYGKATREMISDWLI